MIAVYRKLYLFLFLLLMLLPAQTALADTGPKPTMEFIFNPELLTEPVTILSGVLYECQQPDCSDAQPLMEGGPQGFRCSADGCNALAYGFAPYHRIEIQFSDGKTRISNIFKTAGFDSVYEVTVRPEDLLVEAQFNPGVSPWGAAIFLLCCCLCGGLLVIALVIFLVWRSSRK